MAAHFRSCQRGIVYESRLYLMSPWCQDLGNDSEMKGQMKPSYCSILLCTLEIMYLRPKRWRLRMCQYCPVGVDSERRPSKRPWYLVSLHEVVCSSLVSDRNSRYLVCLRVRVKLITVVTYGSSKGNWEGVANDEVWEARYTKVRRVSSLIGEEF